MSTGGVFRCHESRSSRFSVFPSFLRAQKPLKQRETRILGTLDSTARELSAMYAYWFLLLFLVSRHKRWSRVSLRKEKGLPRVQQERRARNKSQENTRRGYTYDVVESVCAWWKLLIVTESSRLVPTLPRLRRYHGPFRPLEKAVRSTNAKENGNCEKWVCLEAVAWIN